MQRREPRSRPFVAAWVGWLGEPGLGNERLKTSGLYVQVGRVMPAIPRGRSAAPYTGWAGFNAGHGLPQRASAKELLIECAKNDIRVVMIGSGNLELYGEVDREISLNGRRWVLSHISTFSPKDVQRVALWDWW